MTVSRDTLLFSCVLGTPDDPTPALQTRLRALPDGSATADLLRGAINALTDAEIHIRLATSSTPLVGDAVATDLTALQARHQAAIEAARALIEQPTNA